MNLDLGSLGPSPMKTRSGKAQKEKKVEIERVSIMGNKMCRYYNYKLIVVLHLNFCYWKKNFVQIKTKSKKNPTSFLQHTKTLNIQYDVLIFVFLSGPGFSSSVGHWFSSVKSEGFSTEKVSILFSILQYMYL